MPPGSGVLQLGYIFWREIAGIAFNVNSTQQLSDILFGKLGLPTDGLKKTQSGAYSTAADVLEGLRGRHEIQILGDYGQDKKPSPGGNGALYNFKAPDKFVTKPAGEWQTVEATMIGNRITVVMNGVKIHDNVVCDRATGSEIDNKVNEPGPLFLQGDHGTVSFRNIRIKELPKE